MRNIDLLDTLILRDWRGFFGVEFWGKWRWVMFQYVPFLSLVVLGSFFHFLSFRSFHYGHGNNIRYFVPIVIALSMFSQVCYYYSTILRHLTEHIVLRLLSWVSWTLDVFKHLQRRPWGLCPWGSKILLWRSLSSGKTM